MEPAKPGETQDEQKETELSKRFAEDPDQVAAFEERMKNRKAAEEKEEADKAAKLADDLRGDYLKRTGRKRMEP